MERGGLEVNRGVSGFPKERQTLNGASSEVHNTEQNQMIVAVVPED